MIQKLILINSANFNFLEISLEKDLFFLGNNGSGKTTAIRAIHYLFSGDVRNLGIPTDKDGFKEYYFRYPNSYMIYVFEDFFIFMYKTSGEIVKLFSKQKFNINKVIDEESNLYELSAIKKYAKTPNMKKTVKSLSEYRDIIYGNNKRFLDFKFTNIKNIDVFLGLFNEIFNIDKSIIDSKSIKRAIQTTLDYEKKVLVFEHDKYLQDIYTFQSQYNFFREFENQKENIDGALELKNKLLEFEEELHGLVEYILDRSLKEKILLDESKSKYLKLENSLSYAKRFAFKRQRVLSKCDEYYREYTNKLSVKIETIKKLKEKFSQENLLIHRNSADKYESREEKYSEIKEKYIKLKSGFENEIESIESEIKSLHYRRDRELQRELENKKENKKEFLKAGLEEKIESEELSLQVKQSIAKSESEVILAEIKTFQEDITRETVNSKLLTQNAKKELKSLNEYYEKQELDNKKLIGESEELIDIKRRKIKELEFYKEEFQRDKVRDLKNNSEIFESEKVKISKEIAIYESMISIKPNSFKEFLNEEVDGWESKLYPLLDDSLLERDVDELRPSLISQERLLSIELQTSTLKKILTKDEASLKIEMYTLELENLQLSFEKSLEDIELKFKEKLEKKEEQILFLKSELETQKENLVALKEGTQKIALKKEQEVLAFNVEYNKKYEEYQKSISAFHDEIQNSRDILSSIDKRMREDKRTLFNNVKDLQEEYEELLNKEYILLQQWLEDEKNMVDSFIKVQEDKKSSITQDERIKELEQSLKELELHLSQSRESQLFLQEYENSKENIKLLLVLENSLENRKLRYDGFSLRFEQKIENYKYEIEQLNEDKNTIRAKDKLFKKGLDAFELFEFDFKEMQGRQSKKYLYELLESYNSIILEYKNQKINLKSKLDRLNRLKNTHNDIDIYFNFDEYDSELYLSSSLNIVTKIDEIHEYKNKKLQITKESGHKKFRNFVNNSLPQNMSVFNDSEDKFLTQVAKINKNLSGIDFGVIKDIKLNPKVGDKKSIAKLLSDLNESVVTLSSLLNESSLFYEQSDVLKELAKLEIKFKDIKKELKGSAISVDDTIDLSLSFRENEKLVSEVTQLKNESSTGGSMLLKIAIAISILQLFIREEKTPFFLIVDEVSRLHSDNQEKLRSFANSKGFGIVFVTPEPTYSKPEFIKYYRFQKNRENEFEAIELNI